MQGKGSRIVTPYLPESCRNAAFRTAAREMMHDDWVDRHVVTHCHIMTAIPATSSTASLMPTFIAAQLVSRL